MSGLLLAQLALSRADPGDADEVMARRLQAMPFGQQYREAPSDPEQTRFMEFRSELQALLEKYGRHDR